jgi:protein Hikeshi
LSILPTVCGYTGELVQLEGTKLGAREEFAKKVALNLFRFMESFNVGQAGDKLIVPTNCLELWFTKFQDRFRRDPDFLTRDAYKD